ncbi:unnamed protein product [Orchesella dallaii]|uniref:Uncharacterized protein n=1 Tax=Orchesella dallaii TaxID=48710 RepID=A0ABP1RZ49_9HEXA
MTSLAAVLRPRRGSSFAGESRKQSNRRTFNYHHEDFQKQSDSQSVFVLEEALEEKIIPLAKDIKNKTRDFKNELNAIRICLEKAIFLMILLLIVKLGLDAWMIGTGRKPEYYYVLSHSQIESIIDLLPLKMEGYTEIRFVKFLETIWIPASAKLQW